MNADNRQPAGGRADGPPRITTAIPAGAPATTVGAMPAYRTRLVDRETDLARLRELLIDRRQRLVVITGPGGVGKTRLAVQVARDLAPRFRHGARMVPLASVTPGADLEATVARHFGLQDSRHHSYRDSIARHLADREMLLVLDNGELAPEIADLLAVIRAHCPAVAMLVTSRHTLDVYGEAVHEVVPLAYHAPGDQALGSGIGIDSLRQSPSVQLLRERVRAIDPDFEVTSANAVAIAAICRHLGGLPLVLELIAPQLAAHDAATILAQMRASGVAPSPADAPLRLSARLGYQRLDAVQQRVFRALSIMCGRWLLDDVLPILPNVNELDAIDHIDTFVRSSLLTSIATAGEVRFSLIPVLRHIGRERLDDLGESEATAARHADRMVQLAEESESQLTGPDQAWWLVRIDDLHDDMHDAHAWLLDHGRPADALRLAAALWRFAFTRGRYRAGRRLIETALERVSGHDALRSHALNGVGRLATPLHAHEDAHAAYRRALALAESLDLHREIAVALVGLARLAATVDNDLGPALDHLRQAGAIYEQLGDARGLAVVLTHRGEIAARQGRLDDAFTTHEEAGALYARTRDTGGIAWSRMHTGRIAARQGRFDAATTRLLAALDGYVSVGDVNGIAEVQEALAVVASGTGDLERASTLLGAAATTRASIGSTLSGADLAEHHATLAAAQRGPTHEAAYARGTTLATDDAIALVRAFPMLPRASDMAAMRDRAHTRFGITAREHDVLTLLADDLPSQEIADRLTLSIRTVHTHTASLMHKLDVHSRVAAARVAHQAGIVSAHQHDAPRDPEQWA